MWKLPDGRDWLWGKQDLALVGRAMLNKSLIQFSADGWGCVPALYLGLRPNSVRGNGDLLQKDLCQDAVAPMTVVISARDYAVGRCQPTPVLEAPEHSTANLAQSLVGSLLLSPGSWYTQGFVCALQESVFPVLWKYCNQIPLASKVKFPGDSQVPCRIPRWGNMLWALEICNTSRTSLA